MSTSNNITLIFQKWTASLKSKDRSKKATPSNFDELFYDLKTAGASFDEAHALLEQATKAHLPSSHVRKETYKKLKKHLDVPEKEFNTDWDSSISAAATDAFFSVFPLKLNEDDDGEPKVYGGMSAKEHRAQKSHASSFPIADTTELVKRMKERKVSEINIETVLGANNDK